jgi:hypothetical protein
MYSFAIFQAAVVERTGMPDTVRCVEEGIDPRVRQNSVTGAWHSLNVGLVCIGSILSIYPFLPLKNSTLARRRY